MNEPSKEDRLDAALDLMEKDQDAKPSSNPPQERTEKEFMEDEKAGSIWGQLGVFLSLIGIGIASFAAIVAFELKQSTSSLRPQHPSTIQSLASLRSAIQGVDLQLKNILTQEELDLSLDLSIAQQQSSLSAVKVEIEAVVAGLKQSIGTSSEDWLLAEAEYLIRLANQHVKMEQDAAGALTLLATADEIIQDAHGIVAYDLRKYLAEDMAALKSVGQLDTDGVFVQLGALVNQVNKLEQKKRKFEVLAKEIPQLEEEVNLLGQISVFFRNIGVKLGSLVDYRRDGELVTPILPPQEDYYLRQNLVMKMQHAQIALLRRNQQIFDSSLVDSIAWINQYFDPEHNVTIAMLSTLTSLKDVKVEVSMPEISGSLREIRKLMTGFSVEATGSEK